MLCVRLKTEAELCSSAFFKDKRSEEGIFLKKMWKIGFIFLMVLLTGCKKKENEPTKIVSGMKAIEQSDYETAVGNFEAAIATGEDLEAAYRGLGMAYLGQTDYDKAVECFELALQQAGGKVGTMEYDISYYLAVAEYKRGAIDNAIQIYTSIIALDKKNPSAYFLRGVMELEKGEYEAAIKDFNEAITRDEKNDELYIDIFQRLKEFGYVDGGKEYLNKALGIEGFNNYQKGRLYYFLQDYENARNFLETARSEGKEEPDIILYLGKTYEDLGGEKNLEYAISLYRSYLEKNPKDEEIYNQMGLCQMGLRDYEGALGTFQAALAIEGNTMTQNLKFHEIVAYEYMSDFKNAAALMEEYIRTYPDDEAAKREYIFLKTR